MGEVNPSDCSWKKMVIAKSDNAWISTIKTEKSDVDNAKSTTNFSLDFGENVKRERVEIAVDVEPLCHDPDSQHDDGDYLEDPLSTEISSPSRRGSTSSNSYNSSPRRRGSLGIKGETPEERAVRLAKMSAYAAQRLANETPEQRAARLKRMSQYAARRLAQETKEQRAARLSRMSAYAARRLANETPEQRKERLARMSAYAARRHAAKKQGNSNS